MLHGQHQLRFNTAYTDHTSRLTHTRHARRTYPVCKARDSSTEATYANERVQSGLASSAELQQAPQLSAAEAYQQGSLAFGFAAGGLLFPYYLGVAQQLQQMDILQHHTQLAGASAGSLIAACIKSGLPLSTIQDACFELAANCRNNGTRHRLGPVLRGVLHDVLPADAATKCSRSVHVAVTQLAPRYRPRMVSKFRNRDDLIAALMTSCHIPWYFDGSLFTSFRKVPAFDGGVTNFLPDVPSAGHTCRVCCLPSKQLSRIGNISISPDTFVAWPYTLQQMLGWALEPADDDMLLTLIDCGRRDALAWAEQSGVAAVASAANSVVMSDDSQQAQSLVLLSRLVRSSSVIL